MALIATPGDPNADSYFTLDEASAYFTARANTTWTGATEALEAAARLGTQYLENGYRDRWQGYRSEQAQSLAWPRIGSGGDSRWRFAGETFAVYGIIDSDGFEIPVNAVPKQVKQAAMEAAIMSLNGVKLEPTLARGGAIKSQSKSVGPLSKSTTWEDGAPAVDRYSVIDGYLRGLVKGGPGSTNGMVSVVRA